MKTIYCFALPFEAEPWLNLYQPKLLFSQKKIRYYESKNQGFLISGMGAIQMALAISWLFVKLNEKVHFINIGFAASANSPLYIWHEIISVHHAHQQKIFLPEILYYSDLKKSKITSIDFLADNIFVLSQKNSLIDMEAYAFMTAATHFVPITQVHLLKFISDKGINMIEDIEVLKYQYQKKLTIAIDYVENLKATFSNFKKSDVALQQWEEAIINKLPFTFTQQKKLQQKIRFAYYYKQDKTLQECSKLAQQNIENKEALRALFHELIKLLSDV